MNLTSLRRIRAFCAGEQSSPLTSGDDLNRYYSIWLPGVSALVERYLRRTIEVASRTLYLNAEVGRREFWVPACPIVTLTSLYEDATGVWSGAGSLVNDVVIGPEGNSILLPFDVSYNQPRAFRLTYAGGLAYHAVNSVYSVTVSTGTLTVDNYVRGATSGAVGLVVGYAAGVLTVEVYYGRFAEGETLYQYDSETGGTSTATATLVAATRRALVEEHPAVVLGAEMQLRYMVKHALDFENSGYALDSVTRLVGTVEHLRPEVQEVLHDYVRRV